MYLTFSWEKFLGTAGVLALLLGGIAVAVIFIARSLKKDFREVFRAQSRFDIELRKAANLISKVVPGDVFAKYANAVIKEMPYEEKKALLELVDATYPQIDKSDPQNRYVAETYENLQELRRNLDSKVLSFNHQILLFPFNVVARFLNMKEMHHYTHQ